MPKLLLVGLGLIVIYCIAITLRLGEEYSTFTMLVEGGGSADPVELAKRVKMNMYFSYTTRISLGAGLICITLGLYQMLNQVTAKLTSHSQ